MKYQPRPRPDGTHPEPMEYPDQIAGQVVDIDTTGLRFSIRDNLCDLAVSHRMSTEDTARYIVAAGLMLCWPSARIKRGVPAYHNDILSYGALVWDFLRSKGAEQYEIIQAGNVAIQMLMDGAPRPEDLVKALGNSPGQSSPEGPGSAIVSPSSGGGDGSQGGSPPWT